MRASTPRRTQELRLCLASQRRGLGRLTSGAVSCLLWALHTVELSTVLKEVSLIVLICILPKADANSRTWVLPVVFQGSALGKQM